MKYLPLQLPESTYELLLRQADALQATPEEALQLLLVGQRVPPDPAEAQSAARRLASLFADVNLADFDALVDDPAIALENRDLADSHP